MLKFKIDSESFDKLNDVEKTFYAQAGEGYQLQVEGATDKSKLDEFRASNVDLLKQQEAYKGVNLEKYRELEEQERKLRDKELIDKGEFDTLVSERTNAMKSDYEAKITNLNEQLNSTQTSFTGLQTKHFIEGEAAKAFGAHSIKPTLSDAVMLMVNSKFSMDNGKVVARDGDNILAGADGNLTVSEFIGSLGEDYKIQSNGGNGNGNEGSQAASNGTAKRDAYSKLLGG